MAAEYIAIVTDMGTKKMLEAVGNGKKVNITEFAVGDGNGKQYRPTTDMMELVNEVWRGEVTSCQISPESENVLVIETVIPADVGGFTIREMCVYDDEGTMVAVCNTPDTTKVRVVDGVVHELSVSMEILLSNTDSVNLMIDPSVIMATKKDLQTLRVSVDEQFEALRAGFGDLKQYAEENREMIYGLQEDTADKEVRLSLLELMYATEINKNPFTVTFGDFSGLVVEGIWNVPLKRVEF